MKHVIISAKFVGKCTECGEPTTGEYDSDADNRRARMKCVSCGETRVYMVPLFAEMKSLGSETWTQVEKNKNANASIE